MIDLKQHAQEFAVNGYCLVPSLFDAEEIEALRATTERVIATAYGRLESDNVFDLEQSHRPDTPRVRRIKKPHEVDPHFRSFAQHPKLTALLAEIVGANVRLNHSKVNLKSARYGAPLEWHQDWAFIPHTNMDMAICAVMLDDSTMDNGPVLILPGSHRGPLYDHHHDGIFYGAIDVERDAVPVSEAVPMLGPAGSVSLHHPMTVHGSALNKSDGPRRLLFYEYAAADAWPLHYGVDYADYDSRMVLGVGCNEPRLEPVFVRMPFPAGETGPSLIYAQQEAFPNKYFETASAKP